MKDLTDFIAVGKEIGLEKKALLDFAQVEYQKYLDSVEKDIQIAKDKSDREEKIAKDNYDREMRLLERKAQISDNERGIAEASGGHSRSPHVPTFKFTPYNEKNDDLDTWFTLFERQCETYNVKGKDMKAHLLSLFSGQCREAFLSLNSDASYANVRSALLQRFNLTKHDYRKKFFDISPHKDETIVAYSQRLSICFDKWTDLAKVDKDFNSLRDLILSHRILESCNAKLVSFLLERDSNTLKDIEENATRFFQAHVKENLGKSSEFPYSSNNVSQIDNRGRTTFRNQNNFQNTPYRRSMSQGGFPRTQSGFKKYSQSRYPSNHRYNTTKSDENSKTDTELNRNKEVPIAVSQDTGKFQKKDNYVRPRYFPHRSKIQCWICSGWGHVQTMCPSNLKINCSLVENWRDSSQFIVKQSSSPEGFKDSSYFTLPESLSIGACNNANMTALKDHHVYSGLIEIKGSNKPIKVLRDTGSMIHAVHKQFVKPEDYTGKSLSLITFGGKRETFKLAKIVIDTPFLKGTITACVLDEYPEDYMYYDILIGNGGTLGSPKTLDPTPEVIESWELKQENYNIKVPDPINVEEVVDTHIVDEVLSSNQVQTRAQKLNNDKAKPILNDKVLNFDISYTELAELQRNDKSLSRYFELVDCVPKKTKSGSCSFEIRNGILVRIFISDRYSLVQVMIPETLRAKILSLGHDMPFSAHMGIYRTLVRVTSSFYWPGMTTDVRKFCKSCELCLKTSPKGRTPRAPLQNGTPVIDRAFHKCACDLIGPLPLSDNKNMYVLTVIDYATRWVEAVPLRDITAPAIAEELVKIFSRIGIPAIILSDGGPQFVADLMEKVLNQLGIHHSVSTPYHPQSNGLCERANETIKSLIKKVAHFNPTNWDRYLPCVLFAYREVPQETTGYAPFELVYGSLPRGPMSLVKDLWLQPSLDLDTVNTYQYVTDLKQRISSACKFASQRTEKQMEKSKKRYDSKAKHRSLAKGDQVLLFLPCGTNKINNEWKGPFEVVDTVPNSSVNYVIDINGRHKTYHINMLKEFVSRPQHLIPNVDTLHCSNVTKMYVDTLLSCTNVAIIDDNQDDNVDLEGTDSFSNIVLPSLEKTETVSDVKVCNDLSDSQKCEVRTLLNDFSDLFSDVPGKTECVEHKIQLTNQVPIRLKPYPLPFASEEIVKNEVDNMLKAGVIKVSNSPYSSPIVLVKQKGNKTRFCIDYRRINQITVGDAAPIPDQDLLFAKLCHAQYFTKIDMTKGYWQVGIDENSQRYTAFQAGSGLYEFVRMPFGLKTAPATFNRMMSLLLDHRYDTVYFFEDVTIFNQSWTSHIQSIKEVFTIFKENNLTIRPTKTEVGFSNITFLGHEVGRGLLKPVKDNVNKIISIKVPKTKKQVRGIIGLVNYYGKFLPNLSSILIPLHKLTGKGMPDKVQWTDSCQCAVTDIQDKINKSPVLILPDLSKTFIVQTDASGVGLGATLLQERDGVLRPCLFLSRKLEDREKRYSIIERECLGIVWALQKLSRYLLGRKFLLQTDHRPLKYMNSGKTLNARICRWALILQQFDFAIDYISGPSNAIADFLSRNL